MQLKTGIDMNLEVVIDRIHKEKVKKYSKCTSLLSTLIPNYPISTRPGNDIWKQSVVH